MPRFLIPACAIALMWLNTASASEADESVQADSMVATATKVQLRIDSVTIDDMQLDDTLEIILDAPGSIVAGFELKFGCSSKYAQIVEVLKGEVPDSCRWEFFRATELELGLTGDSVGQLWKVTALAKMSADKTEPPCYSLEQPASLVKLIMTSMGYSEIPDHDAEIFFYWEDCRDNVLSDKTGGSLMISKVVIDSFGLDTLGATDGFPTRNGTPTDCLKPNTLNPPERLIEFHNGGVEFKLKLFDTAGSSDTIRRDSI